MRRQTVRRIIQLALVGAAPVVVAAPAHAQLIGPCPSIIMPPPCIIFDAKKLTDIATKNSQDLQKIQQTVQTIEQAKAATQGILSDTRSLGTVNITTPTNNAETSPLFTSSGGSMTSMMQVVTTKAFSQDQTADGNAAANNEREAMAADANAEAYAYGTISVNEVVLAENRYANLQSKACQSTDLRNDWAVNSQIKMELINARARQSYLLSEFVKLQASNNLLNVRSTLPSSGVPSSTMVSKAAVPFNPTDQSGKVTQLIDLLASARSIMGSLGVVQMTSTLTSPLQSIIDQYNNTVAQKATLLNTLTNDAINFRSDSGKGSSSNTVNAVIASLGSVDQQMATLRSEPISSLSGAFATRGIDAAALQQADVDPRQFIGTWADPTKGYTTCAVVLGLIKGSLKNTIKGSLNCPAAGSNQQPSGSGDQMKLFQAVYDYNNARLEEAWEKGYAADAQQQIAQANTTIAQENTLQGQTVDEAVARTQLEQIVTQANQLGQQIGSGTDAGAKTNAAAVLAQLQELVGSGTSLPVVDVSGTATSANPVSVTTGDTTVTTPDPTVITVNPTLNTGNQITKQTGQENIP